MQHNLTKICPKCNEEKSLKTGFWMVYGRNYASYCKKCSRIFGRKSDKEYQRKKRSANPEKKLKENREYREKYPERYSAQKRISADIVSGKIKKQPCVICGIKPAYAHHEDYSKPLEIIWLCPSCHKRRHLGQITLKELKTKNK